MAMLILSLLLTTTNNDDNYDVIIVKIIITSLLDPNEFCSATETAHTLRLKKTFWIQHVQSNMSKLILKAQK